MFGKIPLTKTLTAVADSCEAAERALRVEIQNKHEAADEELITRLFHGELRYALRKASEDHLISRAFERDVTMAIGGVVGVPEAHDLSVDLFAESRFHKRSVESKTGGDFGLLIVRPSIRIMSDSLEIRMARQGLLCQAKLKHGKKWDSLTDTQKRLLKNRTSFLSLLLYSYSDNQLSRLNPIEWQSCNGSTVKKIGDWLKTDEFPSRSSSSSVIHGLGSGTLGTDNKKTIEELIAATTYPVITIRIDWPDDKRPREHVPVSVHQTERQQLQQVVILRS